MASVGARPASPSHLHHTTCAVCCQDGHDRRLLSCLHSFCATCIDQLPRSEKPGKLNCPLCRAPTCLPNTGAAGLPKDVTQASQRQELRCAACDEESEDQGRALVWCDACKCVLCAKHISTHLLSGAGPTSHVFKDVPKTRDEESAASLCAEHGERLNLFCRACGVAVCGHCCAFGRHKGHASVVPIGQVTAELKKKVQAKMKKLATHTLPRVQKARAKVDEVSSALASRADEVRGDIRAAGARVVATLQACVEQKVTEVDDEEQTRLKVLDKQSDELKRHVSDLERLVSLTESISEHKKGDALTNLLASLDERADFLDAVKVPEVPESQACLDFVSMAEEEMVLKAQEILGSVFFRESMRIG